MFCNKCVAFDGVLITLTVIIICTTYFRGTRWRSWLRECATSRKVAGSIPDGVIGIIH